MKAERTRKQKAFLLYYIIWVAFSAISAVRLELLGQEVPAAAFFLDLVLVLVSPLIWPKKWEGWTGLGRASHVSPDQPEPKVSASDSQKIAWALFIFMIGVVISILLALAGQAKLAFYAVLVAIIIPGFIAGSLLKFPRRS